jgi:hypothetical protein
MTDSITKPDTKIQPQPQQVSLSFTQVLASVLAAVSASIAASVFGVAGTLIGAALGSTISVIGGFIYARSLERSRQAVRLTLGVAAARRPGRGPDHPTNGSDEGSPDETGTWAGRGRRLRVAFTPKRLALGAGALFVLTMGLITGFELLTGQPVAASVEGNHGSGVSVLGGTEKSGKSHAPTSPAPSSSAPSSTGSASPGTEGPTPTVTVTVSPSATQSAVAPSATQSAVAPSASSSPTAPSADGSVTGTPGGG